MTVTLPTGEPATLTARALWDTLGLEPAGGPGDFWSEFWFDEGQSQFPPGMTTISDEELTGTPTTAGEYEVIVFEQYGDEMGDPATTSHHITVVIEGAQDPDPEPEEPEDPEDPRVAGVVAFLGQADNPELVDLAKEHLPIITMMAKAYTRGGGFTDNTPVDDVAAVITTATARLLANPEQLRYQAGSVQINDSFRGWTLAESFVLNRYRRRAR